MIVKTQAIALRINPFSETSHVVTWLTAEHGKIATIIKGAQRPKNSFLGQYDLFYTCELLFYLRLFQGLHIVKECYPLKRRSVLRTYWPGTACASYFAGLTAKVAPFYAPQSLPELGQGNIYILLETALDFFSAEQAPPSPRGFRRRSRSYGGQAGGQALEIGLFWFELKLLGAMGFAPRLNACGQCRKQVPLSGDSPASGRRSATRLAATPLRHSASQRRERLAIAFSASRGGVFCGPCAAQHNLRHIMPDSLALLRFWQSSRKVYAARNVVCREHQLKDIRIILGDFLQYHFETDNTGREIAFSILRQWQKTVRGRRA